jgi:protein-tyrosine phosphatase
MSKTENGPDISRITDYLFISAWPEAEHVDEILALNIRLILSMHWIKPSKSLNQPPLRMLWLPTIDTPLTPMPIGTLRRGVEAALPVIRNGRAVLSHCKAGVHRSVAMASCVLIGMGYSADDAMHLISEQREVADPHARHIESRIRKFERYWRQFHGDGPTEG